MRIDARREALAVAQHEQALAACWDAAFARGEVQARETGRLAWVERVRQPPANGGSTSS